MNWSAWLQGLISALASGLITALTALVILKQVPSTWEIIVIAIIPGVLNFLSYLKQSPPPIGTK